MQIYTKTDSWFQKPHGEFGQLQTISGKSKKLKFDGLLLSKKYISSAKSLYLEDLCNITFNCLCENPPNLLRHFWNHKSFFTTQLFCIFSSNITYFWQKQPIKVQIFRLSTACVKFHQIPHVIFLAKSQFVFRV